MPAIGRLTQLVFECGDLDAVVAFWQRVLDLPPAAKNEQWATFEWAPVGRLSFHCVAGYEPPPWPGNHGEQQMHLDLLVDDLSQACTEVEAAGATALTDVMDPGPKAWRIYADPDGHPFCLVTVPE